MSWIALSWLVLLTVVLMGAVVLIHAQGVAIDPPRGSGLPTEAAVDSLEAAERLAGAVRLPTISPQDPASFEPGPFLELRAFLERAFPRVHRALRREIVNDYSLLYTWPGTDETQRPVLFEAHMDVVPVEPATTGRWTHPPLTGRIAAGYVWGRGALDDKASVLGLLEAVERLLEEGLEPRRTVYLAFGHDEEIGGTRGAAAIAARLASGGVRLEAAITEGLGITEGLVPGVTAPVAVIGVAEKGYLTLGLTVRAEGGHASAPPARTAAGILGAAVDRLETRPLPAALSEPVRALLRTVAPELPLGPRLVARNLWLFEPLVAWQLRRAPITRPLVSTTIAVTTLHAGAKENVLPTEATATVNVRILPGDDVAGVLAHVRRVITEPRVEVRVLRASGPSPVAPTDSHVYRALAASIRRIVPKAVVAPGLVVGRTDATHYLSLADAAYRFVPLRLARTDVARIHGVDERISVAHYADVIRCYTDVLRRLTS